MKIQEKLQQEDKLNWLSFKVNLKKLPININNFKKKLSKFIKLKIYFSVKEQKYYDFDLILQNRDYEVKKLQT